MTKEITYGQKGVFFLSLPPLVVGRYFDKYIHRRLACEVCVAIRLQNHLDLLQSTNTAAGRSEVGESLESSEQFKGEIHKLRAGQLLFGEEVW